MGKLLLIQPFFLAFVSYWRLIRGLKWDLQPDAHMFACVGKQITLPWQLRTENDETVVNIQWTFDTASSSSQLIATKSRDHFLPTGRYSDRLHLVGASGLTLSQLVVGDTGNYTVHVNTLHNKQSFISYQSSVYLEVADGFMVRDRTLRASRVPVAVWDYTSKQWAIYLRCGRFSTMGQPPLRLTWTTPTGETLSSSGYDEGDFYLSLTIPVEGGNYTCTIPPQDLSEVCYDRLDNEPTSASVWVNDVQSRLTLLEASYQTLKEDYERLEQLHQFSLANTTGRVAGETCQHEIEGLKVVQQALQDEVERLWNTTGFKRSTDHCADVTYMTLDDNLRDKDNSISQNDDLCDSSLPRAWYRFLLNGEKAIVPTSCVPTNRCGTDAPIWVDLDGSNMPEVGDEIVGSACAHWSDNCCKWKSPITVRNCGDFFIYKISPRSECDLALCTEPDTYH